MNAVTVIEPGAPSIAFEAWVDRGRALASERHNLDWRTGEWLHNGRQAGYVDQVGMDFLADNLGTSPKRLKDIARAFEAFPPHLRDASLSIEHHAAAAAASDSQGRLELLQAAKREHWSPEQTRYEAMKARPRDGRQVSESALESFIRHWNRLSRADRLEAAEMIAASHGDEIEP